MTSLRVAVSEALDRAKIAAMRGLLSGLHYSGLARRLGPRFCGRGVIFTLHSVDPSEPSAFDPNGILRVTPEFLEQAIRTTLEEGYDIVSLDEAARRLKAGPQEHRFACFTFDDGYRDNLVYAYPIFKRYGVPMTIYVPPAYLDGHGDLWWLVLEHAVRAASRVEATIAGVTFVLAANSAVEKSHAFRSLYWALRKLPEREMRAKVSEIARAAGYDPAALCKQLVMTWEEVRTLASDPLVTIAAHTVNHLAIAKLSAEEARIEIAESVRRIEAELGMPCRHFSFPYGDPGSAGPRDFEIAKGLGLETAVTTHKDVISSLYASRLCGLPRISLNGNFQHPRFVRVFLSGVPFAIVDAVKRITTRIRGKRPEAPWHAGVQEPA